MFKYAQDLTCNAILMIYVLLFLNSTLCLNCIFGFIHLELNSIEFGQSQVYNKRK